MHGREVASTFANWIILPLHSGHESIREPTVDSSDATDLNSRRNCMMICIYYMTVSKWHILKIATRAHQVKGSGI